MDHFGVPTDKPPLLVQLETDQAAIAAGAVPCAASCGCHGATACLRVEHPHDDDQAVPHLGHDTTGELVQWVHTDRHGPMLTAEEADQAAVDARLARTRELLAALDLDELRAALAGKP